MQFCAGGFGELLSRRERNERRVVQVRRDEYGFQREKPHVGRTRLIRACTTVMQEGCATSGGSESKTPRQRPPVARWRKFLVMTSSSSFELGLDTFGDITRGADGNLQSHAQVIRDVIDEAVLADELGVDCFGVGEHHREDFAISAPEVLLAA